MTPKRPPGPANRLVAVLLCDGVALFEFGIVAEVFGLRRPELGVPWYDMVTVSFDQPPLEATGGVRILPTHSVRMLAKAGTIVIPNWPRLDEAPPRGHARRGARRPQAGRPAAVDLLRRLRARRRRPARRAAARPRTGCTPTGSPGATPRCRSSRRCSTSNRGVSSLRPAAPPASTSALHLVRQDYGSDIANKVARRMVVAPHREGGQSQFVATAMPPVEGSLAPIMEWASARLDEPLTAEALARKGRMSLRTLARRFEAQVGTTPHQWLTHQRVIAAQRLLETSDASIDRVAELSGFVTAETLRHHFRQRVGTSPMAYRRRFAQSA